MLNGNKLKAAIIEKDKKIGDVAKTAGMSYDAITRRFRDPSLLTVNEFFQISEAIGLSEEEMARILFDGRLA